MSVHVPATTARRSTGRAAHNGTPPRYEMLQLAQERADEKHWELIFDSGPRSACRTIVWERPGAGGTAVELVMVFGPDGRITLSERRVDGIPHACITVADDNTSTDLYLQALQMF